MKKNKLRRFYLEHRDQLKAISIPDSEVDVINCFKGRMMTSHEIADEIGIHVSNASSKLTKLFRKGYLKRVKQYSETSGSFIYLYRTKQ